MNTAMRDFGADVQGLGNPFNQVSYKSARFMSAPQTHRAYAEGVVRVYLALKDSDEADLAPDAKVLADRILALRLDGAAKLRKLDPLYLVIDELCAEYGIVLSEINVLSIVSDFAGSTTAGRYGFACISLGSKVVLLNAVAVIDQNGDHKSKEWGARRLATLYRSSSEGIKASEFQDAVFVLDGQWEDKHVARLYRSGWNHVCRLADLEATVKAIFGLTGKKGAVRQRVLVSTKGEGDYDA